MSSAELKTLELKPKVWEYDWELRADVAVYECPFCGESTLWEYIWSDEKHEGCKHVVDYKGGRITFSEDVQ